MQPLRGRSLGTGSVTRGALRDPGLWNITPSGYWPLINHGVPWFRNWRGRRLAMDKQALTELLFEMLAEEQPAARPASAEPVRLVILLATPRRPVRVRGVPARDKDAVTAQRVDANVWDLTTADGSPDIPLPPEVAQRCYGQAEQTVRLTLHRVVAGDGFEPQLEVTPAPERDMLTFVLAFADGEQRTLSVPKPRGRRTNAWSQGCAP